LTFRRIYKLHKVRDRAIRGIAPLAVFAVICSNYQPSASRRKVLDRLRFGASALITVAGLARPDLLVEVQGIAV